MFFGWHTSCVVPVYSYIEFDFWPKNDLYVVLVTTRKKNMGFERKYSQNA